MHYPMILKYQYSYIISGNFYKPAVREYYQLFDESMGFKMVSVEAVTDIRVEIEGVGADGIDVVYKYSRYKNPGTNDSDTEVIEEKRTLKKGEDAFFVCVEKYWSYARGAENGPATLSVSLISYEDMLRELLEESKKNAFTAIKTARVLIDEEMYGIAFEMLKGTQRASYPLGLCYEKGYGTEVDLDMALNIYLEDGGSESDRGIERIFLARGKRINLDSVKKTVLYCNKGDFKRAYNHAVIPLKKNDNTLEDMRKNVELNVLAFLETGRPFNDPFNSPTSTMADLATYYDLINDRPEEEKPSYHTVEWEDDPYDGGHFRRDIYHNDLIVKTLQGEAEKNDPIALGALLVQFGLSDITSDFSDFMLDNGDEIRQRLFELTEKGGDDEAGMAGYFLGLHHERVAKKANECYRNNSYIVRDKKYTYTGEDVEKDCEAFLARFDINPDLEMGKKLNAMHDLYQAWCRTAVHTEEERENIRQLESFIVYLYNIRRERMMEREEENRKKALRFFEASLARGFHLSVCHLTNEIIEEKGKGALEILERHENFIPRFNNKNYSHAQKYHELLDKLRKE